MDTKEGNKLIAEFMGYKYFEPDVLIDFSDCGGIYDAIDVYSKVPIQVNDYGDGGKYFKRLPNPDYKNENSPKWNPDIEELDWDTLNHREYIYDLKYHYYWDELMPVIKKCWESKSPTDGTPFGFHKSDRIESRINPNLFFGNRIEDAYNEVVGFIEWYNKEEK